jgi:MoaA/NifB/PqqE/SkfB family radical SAM enzyme
MGFMDFGFTKISSISVEGSVKALTMASRGEPLLHNDFGKMLDYAKGKFFELKVNTNAMLLDEDMAHKLLASGVNDLVFSIDSADKAQYEKIRVGAKFDTVLENIKNFNNIR